MCETTKELKLCTCSFKGERPKDYWILYNYNDSNDNLTLGLVITDTVDIVKEETLKAFMKSSLNARNCFDTDIVIQPLDLLEIHLTSGSKSFTFYFEFVHDRWQWTSNYISLNKEKQYDEAVTGVPEPGIEEYLKRYFN